MSKALPRERNTCVFNKVLSSRSTGTEIIAGLGARNFAGGNVNAGRPAVMLGSIAVGKRGVTVISHIRVISIAGR